MRLSPAASRPDQVIARPSVAEAIVKYMHQRRFRNYPATAVRDIVTVYADDTFF